MGIYLLNVEKLESIMMKCLTFRSSEHFLSSFNIFRSWWFTYVCFYIETRRTKRYFGRIESQSLNVSLFLFKIFPFKPLKQIKVIKSKLFCTKTIESAIKWYFGESRESSFLIRCIILCWWLSIVYNLFLLSIPDQVAATTKEMMMATSSSSSSSGVNFTTTTSSNANGNDGGFVLSSSSNSNNNPLITNNNVSSSVENQNSGTQSPALPLRPALPPKPAKPTPPPR